MNKKYLIKSLFFLVSSILLFIAFCFVSYIKLAFPLGYDYEIRSACYQYDVDENLVRAIINVESGYNELAVSHVGAKGLMQIMPETAKWIADELDIDNYQANMLFNAEINIKMGVFYINYLVKKYENFDLVLFAYNAGEGRLLEYLSKNNVFELEKIDVGETRAYIKKVKKNYTVYKNLYELV